MLDGCAHLRQPGIAWAVCRAPATNGRIRPKRCCDTIGSPIWPCDARRRDYRRRTESAAHLPRKIVPAVPIAFTAFKWPARQPAGPGGRSGAEILGAFEPDELTRGGGPSVSGTPSEPQRQLGLFQAAPAPDDRFRAALTALDVDRMTPLEALTTLAKLKKEAEE